MVEEGLSQQLRKELENLEKPFLTHLTLKEQVENIRPKGYKTMQEITEKTEKNVSFVRSTHVAGWVVYSDMKKVDVARIIIDDDEKPSCYGDIVSFSLDKVWKVEKIH